MNLKERAKEVVVDNNGIAKSADFVAAGIRAVDVVNPLHSFELLTGSDNTAAQKLYSAIGFECSGEMHMSKQVK